MERKCEFPDCKKTLSQLVPPDICYCGIHQRDLIVLKIDLAPEELSNNDIQFIFQHPNGCNPKELSLYLEIPYKTFLNYIHQKRIKAKPGKTNGRFINISQEEIIRIISLIRNWIAITTLAKMIKVRRDTLAVYALKGWLGEINYTLQRYLAIDRKWLNDLELLKTLFS